MVIKMAKSDNEKDTKKTTNAAKKSTTKKTTTTTKKASAGAKKATPVKKATTSTKAPATKKTASKSTKTTSSSTKSAPKKTSTTKKSTTGAKKKTTTPKKTTPKTTKKVETAPVKVKEPEIVKEEETIKEAIIVDKKEEKNKNTESVPKSILGLELPEGQDQLDRKSRRKLYMKDALVFAIIIPVLDFLAMLFIDSYKPFLITNSEFANFAITLLLDFILIFGVTYLIDFVFGEDAIKKSSKEVK